MVLAPGVPQACLVPTTQPTALSRFTGTPLDHPGDPEAGPSPPCTDEWPFRASPVPQATLSETQS